MNLNKNVDYRSLFFLVMVMLVSSLNDVVVKFIGQRLEAFQVIFFRFFFGLVTLFPFIIPQGMQVFKTKQFGFNIIRGVLGAVSFFMYTYSVIYLPLVEVVTILWTVPIFVMILSIFFLGEKVSFLRWAATIIGFIGLSFITIYGKTMSISLKWLYIIPITSSFLFAVQDVVVKKIIDNEKRITMLLYFAIVASVLTVIPAFLVWKTPTLFEYSMLLLLGAGGNLIQYFIFKAFSTADLSALSQFRYIEFFISAALAFVFFAEVPQLNVLLGALILTPCTFYLAHSESRKKL